MHTSWNICLHVKYLHTSKIFAPKKYSRPWNVCAHEMLRPMKCSPPQDIRAYSKYLRIHKIYAPHQECSGLIIYDSNKAAVEIFAAYKRCMHPQMYAPKLLLFGLGRISNFWLLLSLAKELSFRWCCLSSMQSSSADLLSDRPAYMGGISVVLYRLVVPARPAKIFAPCQMFAAANISTLFLGKIKNLTRLISVLSLRFKFVHDHKSCPNSAATLLSL